MKPWLREERCPRLNSPPVSIFLVPARSPDLAGSTRLSVEGADRQVIQGLNGFLVSPRDKERKIETMETNNTTEYKKVKEES